jgi:hypothetical protein
VPERADIGSDRRRAYRATRKYLRKSSDGFAVSAAAASIAAARTAMIA